MLYPLYTTEGEYNTLIKVVNETAQVKALKVRLLEAMNGQPVLSFNLYLGPEDSWSAAIWYQTRVEEGEAAYSEIVWSDKSCLVAMPGKLNTHGDRLRLESDSYQGSDFSKGQGGAQGLERARVGYIEVVEMGILVDENPGNPSATNLATQATTVLPTGNNCAPLREAWESGELWSNNPNDFMAPPSGGLSGDAVIINVPEGTSVHYDAIALADFYSQPSHTSAESHSPTLTDADLKAALANGARVSPSSGKGIDAVSLALMAESISTNYLTVPSLGSQTHSVVTFPTKRFYVSNWEMGPYDKPSSTLNSPQPFTNFWRENAKRINSDARESTKGAACEILDINVYDEDGNPPDNNGGIDFATPNGTPFPFTLCWSVNILNIDRGKSFFGRYTERDAAFTNQFQHGKFRINFTGFYEYDDGENQITFARAITHDGSPSSSRGLPVIGFTIISFQNGDVGGLLSNYAGLNQLRFFRTKIEN